MISRRYGFVRGRELEGTIHLPASVGVFPITTFRIMKGWGAPPESAWPYSSDWPPVDEPEGIDEIAKLHRLGAYQRVRSTQEGKMVIDNGKAFLTALYIGNDWFYAENGLIQMPKKSPEGAAKIHSISLFGYDDNQRQFKFMNSWGRDWGTNGTGFLPYSYFENYSIESWTIAAMESSLKRKEERGKVNHEYIIPSLLNGKKVHVREVLDTTRNEIVAWSFGVLNKIEKCLDIEELFVHPNHRFRGYGAALADYWLEKGSTFKLPVTFWISEADCDRDNYHVIDKMAKKNKLTVNPSDLPWAKWLISQ